MIQFNWFLKWRAANLVVNDTDIIPVYDETTYIGNCKISIHGNDVIGHFELRNDFDRNKYVLYIAKVPFIEGDNWLLDGIRFIEYYNGIETHGRPAQEMTDYQE